MVVVTVVGTVVVVANVKAIRALVMALLLAVSPAAVWAQTPPPSPSPAPSPAAATSAPDATRGRQAWVMCGTCHGVQGEGQPAMGVPALGGQLPGYVERTLRAYRAGQRGTHERDVQGQRMRLLALSIPQEALVADIAAHVATLPPASGDGAVRGNAAAGARHYARHCAACHGARGEGQAAVGAPRVAGLGDGYTLTQLRLFQRGERGGAEDALTQQMSAIARTTLREERVRRDVVAFLAGVR